MTGTAIERHQAALVADRQYMEHQLPRIVEQLAHSPMCPDTWRVDRKDSPEVAERKMADLAIIGQSLAEIDVRLGLNVIPQVYVVHGRRSYMAQLQIMLAARFGCRIVPLSEESSEERAIVKVLGKDGEWHRVTVSMADAQRAGWPAKNPNYKTMPDRMLMARAVTKAIGLHCPEALMMLPPGDRDELDFDAADAAPSEELEAVASEPEESGEVVPFDKAGSELVAAYLKRGAALDGAKACAKLMWSSHGLKRGDSILRSRLDMILALLDAAPAGKAAGEPERAEPEVVRGEVVEGAPPAAGWNDPPLSGDQPETVDEPQWNDGEEPF